MIVYYQIGGHKMKTTVFAETRAIAEQKIRQKIEIIKVEEVKSGPFKGTDINDIFSQFGDNFGSKK